MVTLASGPVLSRGAMIGRDAGGALGKSLATGATDRMGEIELVKQYDPIRQVLAERLGSAPATTPGMQMLQGLTQDPLAFAQAMEDPQTIAAMTGTANLATAPKVEVPPEEQAIALMQQAAVAEQQGDTIRPPILRARAAALVPPIEGEEGGDLDVFVAQTPDGSTQVVQRDPESGKWKDRNGQPIELGEEAMIFNVADMQQGQSPREIRNDPNDTPRFVDTGEPVFPGVEREGDEPGDAMSATFAVRANNANEPLTLTGDLFTGAIDRVAGFTPQGLQGEARQVFNQATKDFVTAVLREESGAQINPSEFDDAAQVYIPQPGDKPAVLQAKAASRAAAIAGLEVSAGSALEDVRNAPVNAKVEVTVNGETQEFLVGTVITNAQGQRGIVQYDGTVELME